MTRYLLIMLGFISNPLFAYTGFGICNHGNETLASVICDGPSVFKQTTVKGDMKISGTLQAEGVTAGSLTVLGDTQISNSQVKGRTNIVGSLKANNVRFEKGLNVESDKIFLSQSEVKGSLIITSKDKTPYIELQCGSVIKGNILFDGKAGVIKVTVNSASQGKIQNGSSVFVETPAIKGNCENEITE